MAKRIGVVFPGYGQQFIGMGKDLYDESRVVQEFFEQASSVVDKNFVKLLFASSDQEISSVRYGYLAIFLFEASLYQLLKEQGLSPDFVAGYGIGEYAACFASGSLSLVDGLYFLNKYSSFYNTFLQDKDFAVLKISRGFTVDSLQKLVDSIATEQEPLVITALNTKHGFYLAGARVAIDKVQEYCKKQVIRKVKLLDVGYGLHSKLMDEVVKQISLYYHKISFKDLKIPVITNVDATYVTTASALQSAVVRRINRSLQWYDVSQGFEGCDVIISVGPGKELIDWFSELYPNKELYAISSLKDFKKIQNLFEKSDQKKDSVKNLHDADLVNEKASDYDPNGND